MTPLALTVHVVSRRDMSQHTRHDGKHNMTTSTTRAAPTRTGLQIEVAAAVGEGPTPVAAFDAALRLTGCANYNLVRLSSVIPPGSQILVSDHCEPHGEWGDRLYVVYAAQWAFHNGEAAWAGIGWVQDPIGGAGLFVEHEGHSRSEVDDAITASLASMTSGRGIDLPSGGRHLIGTDDARGVHTCALVIATYAAQGWGQPGPVIREV